MNILGTLKDILVSTLGVYLFQNEEKKVSNVKNKEKERNNDTDSVGHVTTYLYRYHSQIKNSG